MTTLSDTLRPKRPSEGSFAFSSNCSSFEAKPLVAGQFICVSYRRMKSNFLSSDYRCSQGVFNS